MRHAQQLYYRSQSLTLVPLARHAPQHGRLFVPAPRTRRPLRSQVDDSRHLGDISPARLGADRGRGAGVLKLISPDSPVNGLQLNLTRARSRRRAPHARSGRRPASHRAVELAVHGALAQCEKRNLRRSRNSNEKKRRTSRRSASELGIVPASRTYPGRSVGRSGRPTSRVGRCS